MPSYHNGLRILQENVLLLDPAKDIKFKERSIDEMRNLKDEELDRDRFTPLRLYDDVTPLRLYDDVTLPS